MQLWRLEFLLLMRNYWLRSYIVTSQSFKEEQLNVKIVPPGLFMAQLATNKKPCRTPGPARNLKYLSSDRKLIFEQAYI